MIRVIITIAVAILLSFNGLAQNRAVLLHESFDGNSIPAGWSTMGEGGNNWVVSRTNNAGGTPNEMELQFSPYFTGMARLVTPVFDLTGPKGLYFLKATNEGHEITTKLTIQ